MITWKLKTFLEQNNISAYALAKEVGSKLSANTVYSLVRDTPRRVDLESLETLLNALRQMTKQNVQVGHLLEYRQKDGKK
jgi:DNA-binding Xre family transcriptional regulator